MFSMIGRGLPLQLASLLHTPATSCSQFLQASSPSCSRAFAPAVPLSETLFPAHFHLDNTSHPSGLNQCQLLRNEFTLSDDFSHSVLSQYPLLFVHGEK